MVSENIKHLQDLLLIDKVLKVLHEEKEAQIKQIFHHIIGDMVWEHIKDTFSTSYDYDDDLYITFTCTNNYREDIDEKIMSIFGEHYYGDLGDRYTHYQISVSSVLALR